MTALTIAAAYAAGWLLFATRFARWLARGDWCGRYHDRDSVHCRSCHPKGCWGPAGLSQAVIFRACAAALVWPFAFLPLAVYLLASRKPAKAVDLDAEIRRLERETGIGGAR